MTADQSTAPLETPMSEKPSKPPLPARMSDPFPRITVDESRDSPFWLVLYLGFGAADNWMLGPDGPYKKPGQAGADITRAQVRESLLHLLELGFIDIDVERLMAAPVYPLQRGEKPEPGDVWKVSDETVPIGGVAPKSIVSHPDWNGGEPVLILGILDSPIDLSKRYVAWRPADSAWPDARPKFVDSDMQVTPCTLNGTSPLPLGEEA